MINQLKLYLAFAVALTLAGCSAPMIKDSAPDKPINQEAIKPVIVKREPLSRYGNPSAYTALGKTYKTMREAKGFVQEGIASWYGTKFHGRRTSSGEPFDMYQISAAHKTLPLPIYVKVYNLENGKELVVKVNDRGPFHPGRVIDLSYAAAVQLGVAQKGTAKVRVEVLDEGLPILPEITERPDKIFVQVGAFASRSSAERMAQSLRQKLTQFVITVSATRREGKPLYRVRIGPLANEWQARNLAQQWVDDKLVENAKLAFERG